MRSLVCKATGSQIGIILDNTFSNCQVFTIGNFAAIISHTRAIEMLEEAFKSTGRDLFLIDIKHDYEPYVEKYFEKEGILFKQKYKSTNGSNMTTYMINKKHLKVMKYKTLYDQCVARGFKTEGQLYTFIKGKKLNIISNTAGGKYPPIMDTSKVDKTLFLSTSGIAHTTPMRLMGNGNPYCYLQDIGPINTIETKEDIKTQLEELANEYKENKKNIQMKIKLMNELGVTEVADNTIKAAELLEKINGAKNKTEVLSILSDAINV